MALRSKESLQLMFQQSRLKVQREKEEKKQNRIQKYKELSKKADELIKEALQEEKRKKMDYLSTLAPKTPQRALKQPKTEFNIYHSNLIEREPNDRDLFLTREELQQWEKDNWQCINWFKWNELVAKTKKQLKL